MQATTVLVEGESDRLAVETLALRLGHDLTALRVSVVPMGGATSIVHFLDRYGPNGADHRLFGLCDAGESRGIARALGRAVSGPVRWPSLGSTSVTPISRTNSSAALESMPYSTSSRLKASSRRSGSSNASPHCESGQ
jgi:hypothetical protein